MENVLFHKAEIAPGKLNKRRELGASRVSEFFLAFLEAALTGSDVDFDLGQNCQATFF